MDESLYETLVGTAFKRLLRSADRVDPDTLEADGTGDMVTFSAPEGGKVIVNTQRAARQIWVAGAGQGIHFSFDPVQKKWLDDKGRSLELFTWVKDCVRSLCGAELEL